MVACAVISSSRTFRTISFIDYSENGTPKKIFEVPSVSIDCLSWCPIQYPISFCIFCLRLIIYSSSIRDRLSIILEHVL